MKLREEFIKEYKKTTARDWFSLSAWVILFYCGFKIALALFMDHVILHVLLIERFANEGNTELVKAIALNVKWFTYYVIGAVVSWAIYINIKKKK